MGYFRKIVLPILITGIWINGSETIRWIFLVKSYWVAHYQNMGLVFPDKPVNGIVWMIWGFLFAVVVFIISRKFNLWQTTFLSWLVAFVMLWIVLFNVAVLSIPILLFVVPLSLLETFVGALICKKLSS